MRFVTCIACEHQLRLYGHVTRFPVADPAHQILSAREPHERTRPMGRLRRPGICLGDGQMDDLGVLGESGCSDVLLRRMLPYLTLPDSVRFQVI